MVKSLQNISYIIALLCFYLKPNITQAKNSNDLYQKHKSDLQKIEKYLNNISNLSSNFLQESEGTLIEGKFYLARDHKKSGKMRVEYLSDPQILIIVNGPILSYIDLELDEISKLSTNTTPASLLTRPNISFNAKDVIISNIKKDKEYIKISVMKKNRTEAGKFSLKFRINPIEFVEMEVENDLEQVTKVTLFDINFDKKLPNKLFIAKTSRNSR